MIKKKRKFSSYVRKFRGIGCKAYMTNGLLIYGEIFALFLIYFRKPFLIYDFAPGPSELPYI
jgi:hypothetical protein